MRRNPAAADVEALGMPVTTMTGPRRPDDFADFYRAEMPGLVTLARALCSPAAAEDVAQEAMLVAFRRWSQIRDYEHPEVWVRRTCANLAVTVFRRRLVELRGLTRLAARPAAVRADDATEEFWAAVRALPRRQAQAAALRYLYGLSIAQIADTLEITEGAVKVHLNRARAALAAALQLEVDR